MPLRSHFSDYLPEAGVDEAGRGCLAGPVVAAAVIFPSQYENTALNDSKKLHPAKREELAEIIKNDALSYGIGIISNDEIDEINILQATYKAMHQALAQLKFKPAFIIVDGNRFKPFESIPHQCLIKGDGNYQSIAAASILAKTYRDAFMKQEAQNYPCYGWERNMGYGTLEHRNAIRKHGFCPLHRKTFSIGDPQLKLF
ncbi:MAG: ribonuclease HII [Cytophagaceae bacterium]|jgi:ribonuclease HII|nr:ribonuclease HII [Cytophagaceae bacterium]